MDSKIVFDASTSEFPKVILWSPLVGSAIGCLLVAKRGWPRHSKSSRIIGFFMIIAGAVSAIYYPLHWYQLHREATRLLRLGRFDIVQGVVSEVRPAAPAGSADEMFTISSHQFSYSDESRASSCFHKTALTKGPIRSGILLRIKFTGNCILQIEEVGPALSQDAHDPTDQALATAAEPAPVSWPRSPHPVP